MEKEMKKIRVEKTKTGLPALWECGGACSNTGECTIIANKNGLPKKAIYIKRGGHLSNANHALVVLEKDDYIIKSFHKRKDFWHRIYRIIGFDEEGEFATAELINEFDKGEWNAKPPAFLEAAVQAAVEKATCYHCRSPHYIRE